eukprot:TRINITY_DN35264_c0_g1_i1.p1 TRINITY_DN35264_c0_g1~~TRINITY_DN35264_c0_g1_i1.p1  ORF type:complete len:229 (-),score=2.68 TRINITY_DN35264_c0_g1_i1:19-705(-)
MAAAVADARIVGTCARFRYSLFIVRTDNTVFPRHIQMSSVMAEPIEHKVKTSAGRELGGFHLESAPDYLPVRQLRDLQLQRLRAIVGRAYDRVELFRKRCDERHISAAAVHTLADLGKFPFTVKADLRDTYPFGLFASPMEEIVRLHASSGTTGKPIVVAYNQADLDVWASVMVRSFAACGLHRGDIVQNAYGYGLFTGGLGAHYGAEALGATVIPISQMAVTPSGRS